MTGITLSTYYIFVISYEGGKLFVVSRATAAGDEAQLLLVVVPISHLQESFSFDVA
jgi:hypothetical protein